MIAQVIERLPVYVFSFLRYARRGRHPKRMAIALRYLWLLLICLISKPLRSKVQSFRFLGYTVEFASLDTFLHQYTEIFINEEYGLLPLEKLGTIIDCGSNIGMSVLYFKSLNSNAQIQAFEASPATFHLLERNIRQNKLSGVTLYNLAVCARDCNVTFYSERGSVLGSLNPERGQGRASEVRGVPLSRFVTRPVDLLKVDIEGAEVDVLPEFETSGALALVTNLIIEYHHHLPGSTARFSAFLEILERCGFDFQLIAKFISPERGAMQDFTIYSYRPV